MSCFFRLFKKKKQKNVVHMLMIESTIVVQKQPLLDQLELPVDTE